jgi:hypothetical protein
MKRIGLAGVVLAVALSTMVASALAASPIYLCINEKAGGAVKSGGAEGNCPMPSAKAKYVKVALPREESEQQSLLSILSHAKYVGSGVAGKPTIQFTGVNVQVVNGEGATSAVNGEGNLVIGYDENAGKHEQTGSHDLILGEEQTFTSYGGILAGSEDSITAPFASVTGGSKNLASGVGASVSGGLSGEAVGSQASVSGGLENDATGKESSDSGGRRGYAEGEQAAVSGGLNNHAGGDVTSVTGGELNEVSGIYSSVSGGADNYADGSWDSISGGQENGISGEGDDWIGGGDGNVITGLGDSIFGGVAYTESGAYEALP